MRAAVADRYGPPDVVRVVEVPTPRPGSGQALVRVHATAVTAADARMRAARFPGGFGVPGRFVFGLTRPRRKILGGTFSGVVEQSADAGWPAGTEVCGMTGMRMGAHAEYLVMATKHLVHKPSGVSHDDAAGVVFGGTASLHYLRDKGGLTAGAPGSVSVLVVGAAGALGTNAVQLARNSGATVTAVCGAANLALARKLGATDVIDHTATDLASIGERFDLVLDTVGTLNIASGRRLLAPGGRLLLAVATLGETIRARGDVKAGPAPERTEDIAELLAMVADGRLDVVHDPTVAQGTGLDGIVAAHRRVDSGRKIGNIVITP